MGRHQPKTLCAHTHGPWHRQWGGESLGQGRVAGRGQWGRRNTDNTVSNEDEECPCLISLTCCRAVWPAPRSCSPLRSCHRAASGRGPGLGSGAHGGAWARPSRRPRQREAALAQALTVSWRHTAPSRGTGGAVRRQLPGSGCGERPLHVCVRDRLYGAWLLRLGVDTAATQLRRLMQPPPQSEAGTKRGT